VRDSRQYARLAVALCVLAFVLRIGMWSRDGSSLNQDVDAYLEIARHLADGEGFSRGQPAIPTAYRPPLYPLLIAGLFSLGGTPWLLGGVHVVLGTLTTVLTLRCGQLLNLGRASLFAAGLVAIDPLLIRYTTFPMTEVCCAFLVILWCWLVLEFPLRESLPCDVSEAVRIGTPAIVTSREGDAPAEPNTTAGRCPPEATEVSTQSHLGASGGRRPAFVSARWEPRPPAVVDPSLTDASAASTVNSAPAKSDACEVPRSPSRTLVRGCFQGLCFGLICLCRPGFLAAVGLMTLWLVGTTAIRLYRSRVNLKLANDDTRIEASARFGPLLAGLMGLFIVLAPWIIRNAIVVGKPTPATTHGGYTVLLANNPVFYREVLDGPPGAVWTGHSLLQWQAALEVELDAAGIPQSDEVARDKWMYHRAGTIILAQPITFLRACVYRSGCFWALAPSRQANGLGLVALWGITAFYGFISLGLVLGLYRLTPKEWIRWSPLLLLPLTLWLTHLVYWTDTRMRAPVIPILALLAIRGFQSNRTNRGRTVSDNGA